MPYTELLRVTVLVLGAAATALAAVTIFAADADDDTTTLIVAAGWWAIAIAVGMYLGRPERAGESIRGALAGAKTSPLLPTANPGRIAIGRLWPLAAFALVAGVVGIFLPPVAAVGTGYGLLTALAWRSREAIVTAVEERDGVRFYVESASAFEEVRLIRTPGLSRDRAPAGHPPPPPPIAGD
ncbi:MAG: hypothetical protein ACR2N5_00190 [Solirubrobacterales bacterium]